VRWMRRVWQENAALPACSLRGLSAGYGASSRRRRGGLDSWRGMGTIPPSFFTLCPMPEMPDPNQRVRTSDSQQNAGGSDFWADAEIISTYTREQALEDGFLVDVSELAHEAGFRCPVAVTSALWADIENIPEEDRSSQDVAGRLWDVLYMGAVAARRMVLQGFGDLDRGEYQLFLTLPGHDHSQEMYYTVKMMIGPGDDAEPVVTLMKPNED
jgi:hypothetical protein